jgi:hypothetical protein
LQKTKLFLDLFSQAHNTDKYNILGVDKTVKCACISELAAIIGRPTKTKKYARRNKIICIKKYSLLPDFRISI